MFDIKKNDKETTLKSSNSTDNLIKEPEYAYERKFKLKPLAFKQNIEIQRLIDVFKDNSDDDIDELNSESVVRIIYLEQSLDLLRRQAEEYKSNTDAKIESEEPCSKNKIQTSCGFTSAFRQYQQRNRCDSGKIGSKDSRDNSRYATDKLLRKNALMFNERLSLTKNSKPFFKQMPIQRRSKVTSLQKYDSQSKTKRDVMKEYIASRSVRALKKKNQQSDLKRSTDSK